MNRRQLLRLGAFATVAPKAMATPAPATTRYISRKFAITVVALGPGCYEAYLRAVAKVGRDGVRVDGA